MRFLEFTSRLLRVLMLPVYLGVCSYFANRYFEHDKGKAMLEAQVKVMCIEKHACADCTNI